MERADLITPGHSPPLDTLIALGLSVSVLNADPEAEIRIGKEGNRYRVHVQTSADWLEVVHNASEMLRLEVEYANLTNSGKLWHVLLPQPRQTRSQQARSLRLVADTVEEQGVNPRDEYSRPDHALLRREGRFSRRKGYGVAYLQVAPWAGKYIAESYSSRPIAYVTCPLCTCLAWTGLLAATATIAVREERSVRVLYAAPDPISGGEVDLALLLTIFGEKSELLERRGYRGEGEGQCPSLLAVPLLVLASGETLYPLEGEFGVIIWEHSAIGKFIGVRGQAHLPLRPLLEFVASAKSEGRYLAALIDYLGREDPSLISSITECLVYGTPDPYSVMRDLWACVMREESRRLFMLERSMVRALYEVWSRRR